MKCDRLRLGSWLMEKTETSERESDPGVKARAIGTDVALRSMRCR